MVIKCGYDVMYNAHDGTYATCDDLHSTCDVFNREGVMTYRVDEMADKRVSNQI